MISPFEAARAAACHPSKKRDLFRGPAREVGAGYGRHAGKIGGVMVSVALNSSPSQSRLIQWTRPRCTPPTRWRKLSRRQTPCRRCSDHRPSRGPSRGAATGRRSVMSVEENKALVHARLRSDKHPLLPPLTETIPLPSRAIRRSGELPMPKAITQFAKQRHSCSGRGPSRRSLVGSEGSGPGRGVELPVHDLSLTHREHGEELAVELHPGEFLVGVVADAEDDVVVSAVGRIRVRMRRCVRTSSCIACSC